jgi:hypothetical protein
MAEGWLDSPGISRRALIATGLSLVINGGLIAAALLLHSSSRPQPTSPPALIDIEVSGPPAPAPASPAHEPHGAAATNAGTRGRRGHDVPARSLTRSPAAPDPYADLAMSYDAPTGPHPGSTTTDSTGGAHGGGLFGDGAGSGLGAGDGLGTGNGNGLPAAPPAPSLAQPPRPKHEYRDWGYRAPLAFAGRHIRLELELDNTGRVSHARIIEGLSDSIDKAALATASHYEFYPALNAIGAPIPSKYRWDFELLPEGR